MKLAAHSTALDGALILEPEIVEDSRGTLIESFNAREFERMTGLRPTFVQDNHSRSNRSVLRGLHYQVKHPQGKLIRVTAGEIFDVAVDIRHGSNTFGKWIGIQLSAQNRHQLWLPTGYAHGFLVLSDFAEVLYKTTDYWHPESEHVIRWDDPVIGVQWPMLQTPILSDKDATAPLLTDAAELPEQESPSQ